MRYLPIIAITSVLALTQGCSSGASDGSVVASDNVTVRIDTFCSPDRAFADLRGLAQKCVVTTRDMEMVGDSLQIAPESMTSTTTQTFDKNGYIRDVVREDMFMNQPVGRSVFNFEFDSIGNLESSATDLDGRFLVKRNAKGYVTTFTSIGNTGDVDYTQVYTWSGPRLVSQSIPADRSRVNEDGTPIVQPSYKAEYQYDDNGYLTLESEESGDPELQMAFTETTYKYNDYDDHGNWTDRDVVRVAKVYSISPSRKRTLTDSVVTCQSESRQITYFE